MEDSEGVQMGWRVAAFSYWRLDFADSSDLAAILDYLHAVCAPIVVSVTLQGGTF